MPHLVDEPLPLSDVFQLVVDSLLARNPERPQTFDEYVAAARRRAALGSGGQPIDKKAFHAVRLLDTATPDQVVEFRTEFEAKAAERFAADRAAQKEQEEREAKQLADQKAQAIHRTLVAMKERIGRRYDSCRIDTYRAETPEQKLVVSLSRDYCEHMAANVDQGRNVVMFGSVGTGKDHILAAMLRAACVLGMRPYWINGMTLFQELRATMGDGADESESTVKARCANAEVFAISDPVPPASAVTGWQATALFEILDHRYRHQRPTWVTMNVDNSADAASKLGVQVVDRLKHDCVSIPMFWPSFRSEKKP